MIAADAPEVLERFHAALDIVDRIANQTARSLGSSVEKDELLAFGREGLLDAARRFDATRQVPFRAYATYRVRGAMFDGVRKNSRLSRNMHQKLCALEAARATSEGAADVGVKVMTDDDAAVEVAFDEHLASLATAVSVSFVVEVVRGVNVGREAVAPEPTAEEAYARAELLQLVAGALDKLHPDESSILRRFYLDGERMEDIAVSMRMHKSWASRIHTRAIARLTKRLQGAAG